MHGVGEAGAEHRVHFGGDVLDALERLQLGGERTEITESGISETGGGQDVGKRHIKLVGNVFVVGQNPAGQITHFGGGAFVDSGKGVDVQLRIGLRFRII